MTVAAGDLVTWFDEERMAPRVGRVKLVHQAIVLVTASGGDRPVPFGEVRLLKNGPRRVEGQAHLELDIPARRVRW